MSDPIKKVGNGVFVGNADPNDPKTKEWIISQLDAAFLANERIAEFSGMSPEQVKSSLRSILSDVLGVQDDGRKS